jgi:competence protein ComGC
MKTKSFTELEHLVIRVVAFILLLIAAVKLITVELAGLFR